MTSCLTTLSPLANFVRDMCKCVPPQYEKLYRNNTVKKCSLYEHITCLKSAYTAFKQYRPKFGLRKTVKVYFNVIDVIKLFDNSKQALFMPLPL